MIAYDAIAARVVMDSDQRSAIEAAILDELGREFKFEVKMPSTPSRGADPRLSEAVHYLKEWSHGMGRRWEQFRHDAGAAGFQTKPVLQLVVEKVEVKVFSSDMNNKPSVTVIIDGSEVDISDAVKLFGFETKCLLKLNDEVVKALTLMEKALQEKLEVVSQLPDLYGPDALHFKLEREEKK